MLTTQEMELLEAIRTSGSLSQAAARLRKAPSTISNAARQLEARFDVLLFDRRRYRLQLTAAGDLLAREAPRLAQDMILLQRRVLQIARGWEDHLVVATDELMEFETLLSVIREFDALESGVAVRVIHEVLGGTWEALREQRADLVIGATNEPTASAGLHWHVLGVMDWVFAVAPTHPLAKLREPLTREQIMRHRAVVVADTSRHGSGRTYGLIAGQPTLAVPTMRAKMLAQREGLGVGWLPLQRARTWIAHGLLVAKSVVQPREPNTLYLAWRENPSAPALNWWIECLKRPWLAQRLVEGIEIGTGSG